MGAITEIHVPDIGDFKDVEVIEILVKPGESVTAEQSLISVESDKATMEIPSPQAGRVSALRVKTGDKVSEGSLILLLEADAPAAGAPAHDARFDIVAAGQFAQACGLHRCLQSRQGLPDQKGLFLPVLAHEALDAD